MFRPALLSLALVLPLVPLSPAQARLHRGTVAIDVGHGGRDPGAVGPGGLKEKRITLDVSLRLARYLRRRGVRVVLSRTRDRSLPPRSRLRWSRHARAGALLSVHCDAAPKGCRAAGVTTYYHAGSPVGRALARAVQRR